MNKIKRFGKYWIDRNLIIDGYDPDDIFGYNFPRLELPELFDPNLRGRTAWLICPVCEERSQVNQHEPTCSYCGWGEHLHEENEDSYNLAG